MQWLGIPVRMAMTVSLIFVSFPTIANIKTSVISFLAKRVTLNNV